VVGEKVAVGWQSFGPWGCCGGGNCYEVPAPFGHDDTLAALRPGANNLEAGG
jgi:hypothetical protein